MMTDCVQLHKAFVRVTDNKVGTSIIAAELPWALVAVCDFHPKITFSGKLLPVDVDKWTITLPVLRRIKFEPDTMLEARLALG